MANVSFFLEGFYFGSQRDAIFQIAPALLAKILEIGGLSEVAI